MGWNTKTKPTVDISISIIGSFIWLLHSILKYFVSGLPSKSSPEHWQAAWAAWTLPSWCCWFISALVGDLWSRRTKIASQLKNQLPQKFFVKVFEWLLWLSPQEWIQKFRRTLTWPVILETLFVVDKSPGDFSSRLVQGNGFPWIETWLGGKMVRVQRHCLALPTKPWERWAGRIKLKVGLDHFWWEFFFSFVGVDLLCC